MQVLTVISLRKNVFTTVFLLFLCTNASSTGKKRFIQDFLGLYEEIKTSALEEDYTSMDLLTEILSPGEAIIKEFIKNYGLSGMVALPALQLNHLLIFFTGDLQVKNEMPRLSTDRSILRFKNILEVYDQEGNNGLKIYNRAILKEEPVGSVLVNDIATERIWVYTLENIIAIQNEADGWMSTQSNGKITRIDLKKILNGENNLYLSFACFSAKWDFQFVKDESDAFFHQNDKNQVLRRFMNIKSKFFTRKFFMDEDESEKSGVDVVFIPYLNDEKTKMPTYYMVYIVPVSFPDLVDVWIKFSTIFESKIKKNLVEQELVSLRIPLVSDLKTSFDLSKILTETLASNTDMFKTIIETYINIDETCTDEAARAAFSSTGSDTEESKIKQVNANKPYLCLIISASNENICLVKDIGVQ